jgi:hypothetical protein
MRQSLPLNLRAVKMREIASGVPRKSLRQPAGLARRHRPYSANGGNAPGVNFSLSL